MDYSGGCLCGALAYRASGAPIEVGYCHCHLYQRSTGAPVAAWASFLVADFAYIDGKPTLYRSSQHGQREFCSRCGTQIAYRDSKNAKTVDVNVGSLRDPSAVNPQYHIWYESRIPWFETADDLPRYPNAGPDRSRI